MQAEKYPKIETVWKRDPATKHRTLLMHDYARPEFAWLNCLEWEWTEKIDGMNIRVEWDPETGVVFGGRTERSQIPVTIIAHLQETFSEDKMRSRYPDTAMCLYGEGYGMGIQARGKDYIPDGVSFVMFDIRCGGLWLYRNSMEEIAGNLGVEVVPIVAAGSLFEAIATVKSGINSEFGTAQAEGLVMRPPIELTNRRGQRVI